MIVVGALSCLTTSILPLREIMPHYGIFVMIGVRAISYLTTSILPLSLSMPHFVIFVMIGDGGYKLSDHFYSALRKIMPHSGIFVIIGGWGYKLSDHFYSAHCRNYAPIWYVCHDWGGALSCLTASILPLRKVMLHYAIFVIIGGGG